MTLQPKSPRVGRSPKLKAKWLSNTLAYQYGNNGTNKKSEIIVLSNDLDQYLQVTAMNQIEASVDAFSLTFNPFALKTA